MRCQETSWNNGGQTVRAGKPGYTGNTGFVRRCRSLASFGVLNRDRTACNMLYLLHLYCRNNGLNIRWSALPFWIAWNRAKTTKRFVNKHARPMSNGLIRPHPISSRFIRHIDRRSAHIRSYPYTSYRLLTDDAGSARMRMHPISSHSLPAL
jgi:hypothetical protein